MEQFEWRALAGEIARLGEGYVVEKRGSDG
jgi:hypothetical protein